jgi:hypothetical protein
LHSTGLEISVSGPRRTVDEWKIRAEHGDKHWFDGVVACTMAALIQGSNLANVCPVSKPAARKQPVSWAQIQHETHEHQKKARWT